MCLYTKYIKNKKYQPNKKNNFKAPVCKDRRLLLVPAKCGRCIECRKARKREWVIRLNEEIKNNPDKATFWTLTISNEEYEKLKSDSKKKDRDSICKLAVKRMLERIRKKTKKSIRHWFITELGKRIESLTSQIHKTNEESKGIEFNNYLNELRKGIKLQGEVNGKTVWTKGFDEIFKENELQRMLADYGISQKEYYEAKNDQEVAMRLSDALDEIANGKIAVFGKMVEEAKQAKNETARQK